MVTAMAFILWCAMSDMVLVDFSETSASHQWYVVNDGVMGGLSRGHFTVENGIGIFHGHVSLANNGGFSMIKCNLPKTIIRGYSTAVISLKGDGKRYQFRVKSDRSESHSYVYDFETDGTWQSVEIPLAKLVPTFRGRTLNMPDYPAEILHEVAFLIGNKKEEDFHLEIASMQLRK
jgi:hypothetical protein